MDAATSKLKLWGCQPTWTLLSKMLRDREPFGFSRWGDGEWDCMLAPDARKANIDGVAYTHDLSTALCLALKDRRANVMYAMQPKAMELYRDKINAFLGDCNRAWLYADVFHEMSAAGQMPMLLGAIGERSRMLVGPAHLGKLGANQIEIPDGNAWQMRSQILYEIESRLEKGMLVYFCAGMLSNVLINDLSPLIKEMRLTLLDMGSVFDPYAGKATRRYHNAMLGEQE